MKDKENWFMLGIATFFFGSMGIILKLIDFWQKGY